MSKHAVFITCRNEATNDRLTLRVGKPTDLHTAMQRYERFYQRAALGVERNRGTRGTRHLWKLTWERRRYIVEWVEVRSVTATGHGIGSPRHARALPTSYRSIA